MKIIENDDISHVLNNNCYKLFYFTATWCNPCKKIKPLIQKLSEGLDESIIIFYEININSNEELVNKYEIGGIPAFILLDNQNNKIGSCSGSNIANVHELLKLIKKN